MVDMVVVVDCGLWNVECVVVSSTPLTQQATFLALLFTLLHQTMVPNVTTLPLFKYA